MINIKDHGARGVAVSAETQVCPARVHAGWSPGAELRRVIMRAPESDPSARDTQALQAAIDAAAAQGGGTVVVPPGDYLTGPLWLRSHVYLKLEPGATLWGSPELDDYQADSEVEEGTHGTTHVTGKARNIGLINADNLVDTGLIGPGRLHGQGGAFLIPWWRADKAYTLKRPFRLICFKACEQVTVEGIRIEDSPGWTLVFKDCRHVRVSGVRIHNCHGPNVDGIDLENTRFATVSDCDIFTTDDGICLKSPDPEGIVENIAVTNCHVRTLCNAFKIGTETLGTVRDVVFSNCTAYNPEGDLVNGIAAIAVCACDGGVVERVRFQNITARNLRAAFYLHVGKRLRYQSACRAPRAGRLREVCLSGIRAAGCVLPSFVSGLSSQPVEGLCLSDIRLEGHWASGGGEGHPPEKPDAYPSATMFGPLPAQCLYLRHVGGLDADRIRLTGCEKSDTRPARLDLNANPES